MGNIDLLFYVSTVGGVLFTILTLILIRKNFDPDSLISFFALSVIFLSLLTSLFTGSIKYRISQNFIVFISFFIVNTLEVYTIILLKEKTVLKIINLLKKLF